MQENLSKLSIILADIPRLCVADIEPSLVEALGNIRRIRPRFWHFNSLQGVHFSERVGRKGRMELTLATLVGNSYILGFEDQPSLFAKLL